MQRTEKINAQHELPCNHNYEAERHQYGCIYTSKQNVTKKYVAFSEVNQTFLSAVTCREAAAVTYNFYLLNWH